MRLVPLKMPRPDVERFVDLMHLNGYTCQVEEQAGLPTVVLVVIPEEHVIFEPVAAAHAHA